MKTSVLSQKLTAWTKANSGHESHRPYLGLSHIGRCDLVIYRQFFDGYKDLHPHTVRLSLEIEGALIHRLTQMGVYQPASPICEYGGLVQGHPDGMIQDDLLEIKTVRQSSWLPNLEQHRLPPVVFYQVQAYLHFTHTDRAHVIYLARDTGEMQIIGTSYHYPIGLKIVDKIERMLKAIETKNPPSCVCGRCAYTVEGDGMAEDEY